MIGFVAFLISFLMSCVSAPNLNIDSWAYQLQNAEPSEMKNLDFDIYVIDYSRDGSEGGRYSKEEVESVRKSGKVILSYMSIGEAENYRFYWKSEWNENPPDWLGEENPEWEGNYAVKYWMSGWKKIIFQYLSKIKEEGFDGVYLDKVDEFEYWAEKGYDEETLASSMVNFVGEISKKAGTMLIFIQNGERIVKLDPKIIDYVNGIGIEDLWYDGAIKKDEKDVSERLENIRKFKERNKIILVVDYVDDGSDSEENISRIRNFISKAKSEGFIPYAAMSDRELDEIVVIKGIQPE